MNNPLRSLFRSLLGWLRPARRAQPELRIPPELLRQALEEMLAGPGTRKFLLRNVLGTIRPTQGGAPTPAEDIIRGTFGGSTSETPRSYTFLSDAPSTVPLTVKGAAGQNAALQEWKNSAGAVLATVAGDGKVGIGTAAPDFRVQCSFADTVNGNPPVNAGAVGLAIRNTDGTAKNWAGIVFPQDPGNWQDSGAGIFAQHVSRAFPRQVDLAFFTLSGTSFGERLRILGNGNVGIGTTAPQYLQSNVVSNSSTASVPPDGAIALALSNIYVGDPNNPTVNNWVGLVLSQSGAPGWSNDAAGIFAQIKGRTPRDRKADLAFFTVDTNATATEKMRILGNGNVGIGVLNPDVKLRVGGKIYVESRLGFIPAGATEGATEMYRLGTGLTPDNIILRTFQISPSPSTLLDISAPPLTLGGSDREATLALSREVSGGGAEFLDLYNNGYAAETQYGIRIQKRGTGQYKDFVFDQYDGTTKTTLMVLKVDGKVGISTLSPAEKFHVVAGNGRVDLPNDWLRVSDERLKKNVTTLQGALKAVLGLRGVRFDRKEDAAGEGREGKDIGFIAQELEEHCPELVYTGGHGYKSVAYGKMTVILLQAIREQQAQIDFLKTSVEALSTQRAMPAEKA